VDPLKRYFHGRKVSVFNRNLGSTDASELRALGQLRLLTESKGNNWWKDLLRVWVPAGSGGENPVRLAVRDGYLNFYLRGQAVARVGFARHRRPFAETHIKFASPNEEEKGKKYVRLDEGGFSLSSSRTLDWSYRAGTTVERWIERASKRGMRKKGIAEKTFVDRTVAQNGRVIDLEMGLPAWSECPTAKRMDLVALESTAGRLRIVFYEAKTIGDSRLVSSRDPEVTEQFKNYSEYLAFPGHSDEVSRAYSKNCNLLVKLHRLAQQVRSSIEPLDDAIIKASMASEQDLLVSQRPRLIIFDDPDGKRTAAWPKHEDKLRAWLGDRLRVFEHGKYVLW
jgi:hypothetical protein